MDVINQTQLSWQAVQNALASLASVYLQSSDLHRPRCNASKENPICQLIHSNPEAEQICTASLSRHMQTALQTEEPVFFTCPANLHMFAVPMPSDDEAPEFILGGKVYYSYSEFAELQEQAAYWGIDSNQLLQAVQQTQFADSDFLFETARLVQTVGRALNESSHLQRRFENRSALLSTLMRISTEFSSLTSRSPLFAGVLNTLEILRDMQSGAILTEDLNNNAFTVQMAFGKLKPLLLHHSLPRIGLIERLLSTGEPVTSDVSSEILKIGLPKETRPVYLFPLKSNRKILGILLLLNAPLTQEETEPIQLFTAQISPLLENIELHEELGSRNRVVRLLTETTNVFGALLDSTELLQAILDKTTEFLQAEQGSLMLLEEESDVLSVRAIKGLNKTLADMMRIRPGDGISGKVYQTGLPLLVRDISSDRRVSQAPRSRYKTGSFISAPLKVDNRVIGVINLADKATGSVFTEEDLDLLTIVVAYATVAIERSAYHKKTEELRKISITDALTGLLNRRYFQERLIEEVERSRRHLLPLSLMIIDVDDFKNINDTFGHPEGDEILRILAHSIRHYIRAIDVAARYGGEEFTIILPQTSKQDAAVIAERICRGIEQNGCFQDRFKGRGNLTVSIGLATYPDDAESIEDLVRHSDEALYAAKSRGKNCVVLYNSFP